MRVYFYDKPFSTNSNDLGNDYLFFMLTFILSF